MRDRDLADIGDHSLLDLVEDEQLLGQTTGLGELRPPAGSPVDLLRADRPDRLTGDLGRPDALLLVEREADPGVLQRPFPPLGGLEEVGPARLGGRAAATHRCVGRRGSCDAEVLDPPPGSWAVVGSAVATSRTPVAVRPTRAAVMF